MSRGLDVDRVIRGIGRFGVTRICNIPYIAVRVMEGLQGPSLNSTTDGVRCNRDTLNMFPCVNGRSSQDWEETGAGFGLPL